ncbi:MAG TPA: hypothetical protein VK824_10890 [Planctomycetota bacterium]|nr:hypothetical protein [Planctomycetota bacterium]
MKLPQIVAAPTAFACRGPGTAPLAEREFLRLAEMLETARTVADMQVFHTACLASRYSDEDGCIYGEDDALAPWVYPSTATVLRETYGERPALVVRLASGIVVSWTAARGWEASR